MVPLIITLLQWEFVVTTMVTFFSEQFKKVANTKHYCCQNRSFRPNSIEMYKKLFFDPDFLILGFVDS